MGVTVFYLGPEGTHSQEAAKLQFGDSASLVPCGSLSALFEALRKNASAEGIVPVVNSTEGPVWQTLDEMMQYDDLEVIQRVSIPVHHCLLAARGTKLTDIRLVCSHPQALGQSRRTLQSLCPGAELTPMPSTAAAAVRAASEKGVAAVATATAARIYALDILARDVQDRSDNMTRFYLIKQKDKSMNKLSQLRAIIASLDETLVEALCQRARLKANAGLYRELHSQQPIQSVADLFSETPTIAGRARVLRPLYVNTILPLLCEDGDDEDRRKCISTDGSCMNALVQRLNLAEHVAALKLEEIPDSLRTPLENRDPVQLEEAITNHTVEEAVIRRTLATTMERDASPEFAQRIAVLYEKWIIPLSRKIQVHKLLA